MKIVIAGGTGQLGRVLARAFEKEGREVVLLTRDPAAPGVSPGRAVAWDALNSGPWCAELEGAAVVINLAGRNVNCRYDTAHREVILRSRVDSTLAIGRAIRECRQPPPLWLQASTATIYAHRYDAPNDEATGRLDPAAPDSPDTWRFSIGVARAWEEAVAQVGKLPSTRIALLRTAIVMAPEQGGAFDVLLRLVRFGLGGASGDGRQYLSWIHDEDFVRAVRWIMEREALSGPINLAAPTPLPNADFMRGLREAWGIGFGLPANRWMLEVGAFFLRTETELVLKSRRVIPGRLLADGFTFRFPHWPKAAADLCQRWRENAKSV